MVEWNSHAQRIYLDALEIADEREREQFVKEQCNGDESLIAEVEAFLKSEDRAAAYFGNATGAMQVLPEETKIHDSLRGRTGDIIGRYKLLQPIGEGGFGVVYMAEQTEPVKRMVALKVIKPGMDTQEVMARFEAERQALALMDHPNIAKVLDAGETSDGRPFFVMELVKGVPITEYCDRNNLSTRERMQVFADVCSAVQHAHHKGIIHRDLKPANVMISLHDGKPLVKVIDFGIAKAISQKLTERTLFTRYGQLIGTPQYMSPEQAEMSGVDVDTRADVFSLGVLLYELLTGSTPLQPDRLRDAGLREMMRLIQEEESQRPSQRLSSIGDDLPIIAKRRKAEPKRLCKLLCGELDWIVMKAIDKDRRRRYDTAAAFGADVKNYLNGDTVAAVAPSLSYQLGKFATKYRAYAATALLVFATLLTATAFSSWQATLARRARRLADQSRYEAEEKSQTIEQIAAHQKQHIYAADMARAGSYLRDGNLSALGSVLDKYESPDPDFGDLRGFEWWYMKSRTVGDAVHNVPAGSGVVEASADGRFLAYSYDDDVVICHQERPWSEQFRLRFDGEGTDLSFSSDGELLVMSNKNRVEVVRTSDWRTIKTWGDDHNPVGSPAKLSPDGKWLVFRKGTYIKGDKLQVVEVGSWAEVESLDAVQFLEHWAMFRDQVKFSPDSKLLVYSTEGEHQRLEWGCYNLELGRLDNEFFGSLPIGISLDFSPDGRRIALSDPQFDFVTEIWDLNTKEKVGVLNDHLSFITQTAYSPDGRYIVTVGGDQRVNIWNARTNTLEKTLLGAAGEIWGLTISSDNAHIFTSESRSGGIKVWELKKPREANSSPFGVPIGLTRAGHLVLVETGNKAKNRVSVWDGANLVSTITTSFEIPHTFGKYVAAINSEDELFVGSGDGTISRWDLDTGKLKASFRVGVKEEALRGIDCHPKNPSLLVAVHGNSVSLWDADTEEAVQTFHNGKPMNHAQFSPDGDAIALSTRGSGGIRVFDLNGENVQERFSLAGRFRTIGFSPDGKLLSTVASSGSVVIVLDASTGKELVQLEGSLGGIDSIGFVGDGKTLAAACNNNTVRLWNVPTWIEMLVIKAPRVPTVFCPSSDPKRIVMGGRSPFSPLQDLRLSD